VILALDTSTALASVALYDGAVSAEISWRSGRNHSVELMQQATSLMALRKLTVEQLTAVAVATGPGSYTGLRVGLACGKGLCLALGLPMIGVNSLDVLAEAQRESFLPVRSLLDAGRNRFATALYRRGEHGMERAGPIQGKRLSEALALLFEPTLLCGDVDQTAVDAAGGHPLARVASPSGSLRRAGFLAEIAWGRLGRGEAEDPRQVDAIYLTREDP